MLNNLIIINRPLKEPYGSAFCLYLIKLAIYFNTSSDYLIGLTDGKMSYKRLVRLDK